MSSSGCGCGRLRSLVLVAAWTMLLVAPSACSKNTPTSVLLRLAAEPGLPTPDTLLLDLFEDSQRRLEGQRLPAQGPPQLPSEVVLYPPQSTGTLRLLVHARLGGAVIGEGATIVELRSGQQVSAEILITGGRLLDRDGDGVPDVIDNCPDVPNPEQEPCTMDGGLDAGDGSTDAGDGPAVDLGPDLGVDLVLTPDLPLECTTAAQCDDNNDCTADSCVNTACVRTPTNAGGPCDDGNACTTKTSCTAGVCGGGSAVTCTGGTVCKTASCDPAKGCVVTNRSDGSTCDDGKYCTMGTKCTSGVCGGGTPRDCGTPGTCEQLSCNETSNSCVTSLLAAGTSCDDADLCTQGESCSVGGTCDAPAAIDEVIAAVDAVDRSGRSTLVDGSGAVHTVYRVAGTGMLYATNESGSWVTTVLDGATGDFNGALLLADATGKLSAVYVHEATRELRLTTRGSTSWSAPVRVTTADYGTGGLIDSAGTFHLAFTRNGDLRYKTGTPGAAGNWVPSVSVDEIPLAAPPSQVYGYSPSVAMDSKGFLQIAHTITDLGGSIPNPLELRHSTNESGSWVTVAAAPTLTANHGGNASLAIGKNDKLYVSHYSQASGNLYLTQRTGSNWSTQTLASGGVGSFSSLLLDSKDSVHIAYRQFSAPTRLKYLTNVSGAFVEQILDEGSNTGRWTGLARAPSGRLHIVFSKQGVPQLRHHSFSACP